MKKMKAIFFSSVFGKKPKMGESRDTEKVSACMHASVPGHQLCEGR